MEYFFDNDNIIIVVESAIIVILLVACIALIIHSVFLRKEINRISEVRSEAIHGKEKIKIIHLQNNMKGSEQMFNGLILIMISLMSVIVYYAFVLPKRNEFFIKCIKNEII